MGKTTPNKILIVKLSSLGDICHTSLILPMLKKSSPETKITWLVERKFRSLVELFEEVDEIISFDFTHPIRGAVNNLKSLYHLRRKKYDLTIDLQGLLKSGILTGMSRSKNKVGFSPPMSREKSHWFYRQKFSTDLCQTTKNISKKNLLLAHWLGFKGELSPPKLKIFPEQKIISWIEDQVKWKPNQLKIGINPWASFPTKQIPEKVLAKLSLEIERQFKTRPILIFNPQYPDLSHRMANRYHLRLTPEMGLKELCFLLDQLDFYIGTDSGPSYLSQLAHAKGLILFGPTNRDRQLPIFKLSANTSLSFFSGIYSDYQCPIMHPPPIEQPYRCLRKKCKDVQCMKQIKVSRVIQIVKASLNGSFSKS